MQNVDPQLLCAPVAAGADASGSELAEPADSFSLQFGYLKGKIIKSIIL